MNNIAQSVARRFLAARQPVTGVLDITPEQLTDAERRIYEGLGAPAKRLFNDLAWALSRGGKYYGSLAATEAKVELDKKRLVRVHWSKNANPQDDVVVLTTKGERMARRLFSKP